MCALLLVCFNFVEYVSGNQIGQGSPHCEGDDNLPPPPAFLLNPSDHQQIESHLQSSSRCSTPVSHGYFMINHVIMLCKLLVNYLLFVIFVGKGINVAETVKALTELKHTPASPSLLRRSSILQNQQTSNVPSNNPASQPMLTSFQQSKSAFTALQNSNINPIYGTTGHKMFSYVDQNNSIYGSRNNINVNSTYYKGNNMVHNVSENCDDKQNRSNSTNYSATVSYSSSASSSIYSESTMTTFGQKTPTMQNTSPSGHNTFGRQITAVEYSQNVDKKNPFSSVSSSGNSIYAQPSQIIAGFNNLGFGGNRNNEGNMSPLAIRKMTSTPRSQSADRRGSDC